MYDIIIAGAGLAGLSCAMELAKKPFFKIAIIEEKFIGGLLNSGGSKISLFPAGKLTAGKVGHKFYIEKQIELIQLLANRLTSYNRQIEEPKTELVIKKYDSYLIDINKNALADIFLNLLQPANLIFEKIESINHFKDRFSVKLLGGKQLECSKLVIASGRNKAISGHLEGLGQKFNTAMATVGCRCVFDANEANKLHEYQLDFRVNNSSGFRSYCYNYRGDLYQYAYGPYTVVSGIMNTDSNYGNVMIGQKRPFDINSLREFDGIEVIDRRQLSKYLNEKHTECAKNMKLFISQFEKLLGTNFLNFHFPALEQFWPIPLIDSRFASANIPGLYFCGDASGVSFGFVQAYVTGCFVALSLQG